MSSDAFCRTGIRWLKFNAVGAVGIVVQLLVLAVLRNGFHMHYLIATALAVEITVLHNYVWHERFTWADRRSERHFARALKFNVSNGLVSVLGNVALMRVLAGSMHMNYLLANAIAIAACSIANFLLSDRFVFRMNDPAPSLTRADLAQPTLLIQQLHLRRYRHNPESRCHRTRYLQGQLHATVVENSQSSSHGPDGPRNIEP
ncbi:MAG: GtrA family protein [Acidobacteriaceae bacterium]|nr:GtrA family protein [Acidobacteriaceae bacterium]